MNQEGLFSAIKTKLLLDYNTLECREMNKIIVKTIKKAYSVWKPNRLIRCYHYAAAFDNNKMIAFAKNNPIKFNAKAYRMGEIFNINTYKEFPFPHAESHLVSKLLDRYNTINTNWKIVVLRINREGRILGSKPCKNCQKILDSLELQNIYYSDDDGNFVFPKAYGLTETIPML